MTKEKLLKKIKFNEECLSNVKALLTGEKPNGYLRTTLIRKAGHFEGRINMLYELINDIENGL